MPKRPLRPCNHPGCSALIEAGQTYCEKHRKEKQKQSDSQRATSHQRGYTVTWRKYRLMYLREHPLCVMCEAEGKIVSATVVDHIIPHKGDMNLFWDTNNHQALCKRHHDIKTATKDGAFGRPQAH